MRFPRKEYWSGLPFPSPGALLTQVLNMVLLYCRQILYCLGSQGSPKIRSKGSDKIDIHKHLIIKSCASGISS